MSEPRKASVTIHCSDENITQQIGPFIRSFTYIDVASGESDSISVELMDRDKKWIGKWFPNKGEKMKVHILTKNWIKDKDSKSFDCGDFIIDELNYSGWPIGASIEAVSIPAKEGFKSTDHSKTWRKATLEEIAKEIAKRHNIKLAYDAKRIQLDSVEQSKQPDCSFLYELCETYGLAMKVYAGKIIIFEEESYEKKKPILTIKENEILKWSYRSTLEKNYTAAEIAYTNAKNGKDIKVKVGSGNRILKISQSADSLGDAELKAIAQLNGENKKTTTMKVTIIANPKIIASSNVKIEGLLKLDGVYAVDKVTHSVGNGYTMQLELRKIQKRIVLNKKA